MWYIKLISQIGGKFSFQTMEYKTKREAVRAFPTKMTMIQRHGRTYYIIPQVGK